MKEPTRLLARPSSTPPETLGLTLLRAGRDVDEASARARKAALVGGAFASTALGVAAAKAGAKPLGVWLVAKWLVVGALCAASMTTASALVFESTPAGPPVPPPAMPAGVAPSPTSPDSADHGAPVVSASALSPSQAAPDAPPSPAPPSPNAPRGLVGEPTPPLGAGLAAPSPALPPVGESGSSASVPVDATSTLAEELALLRRARAAIVAGQAAEAFEILEAHRRLGATHLGEEAEVLRIEALDLSGDRSGAQSRAAALLKRRPESPYAARLRALAPSNP